MTRRIAVAGWFGSDNLGDELILHCLLEALAARGADPVAISIDAARTRREHEVAAVTHRSPAQSLALRRMLREADAMAVAGGLIQSETSPWNIPFHTSRFRTGRPRIAMAAVGLGVGHVRGLVGRALSRSSLRRFCRIVVRDADSARRLRSWGLEDVAVGADPVMALAPDPVTPGDTMCVILRPLNRRGLLTAAAKAATAMPPDAVLEVTARSIEAAASATGLAPRFVAFQASRDGGVHAAVARRLKIDAELVVPTLRTVVDEVARSKLVVTMRYHGAIAALVHDRPTVALQSSPKMASVAAEGGGWAPTLAADRLDPAALVAAVTDAFETHARAAEARGALVERLAVNDAALDALVEGSW